MKKMLSLAAMFAALSYASPAYADLNFSGDASVRVRDTGDTGSQSKDNVNYYYRIRLNAAADLGDGYFFKALATDESDQGGGWQKVQYGNAEVYNLQLSQLYFRHNSSCDHYMIGRIPLNSQNNPLYDLTLYPTQPFDIPVATINLDRVYGANYGLKVGNGDLNALFVVLDNNAAGNTSASGDGLLNDGYAVGGSYKFNVGNVTFDPQVFTAITKTDVWAQSATGTYAGPIHFGFRPVTLGTNMAFPLGGIKWTASGFYTRGSGTTPNATPLAPAPAGTPGANVDYFGDLFRIKCEYGPFMAWFDHNSTTDKSSATPQVYTNNFIWAQYKINIHESAKGNFTIQPTFRYLSSKQDSNGVALPDNTRLRSELWATVTF